ncbi:hypothetical protein D3C71_1992520 [compost metagenome]
MVLGIPSAMKQMFLVHFLQMDVYVVALWGMSKQEIRILTDILLKKMALQAS